MNRVISFWKSPSMFVMPEGTFKNNGAGFGRRYLSFTEAPFRNEAFASFGFADIVNEPTYKNLIGNHYLDGSHTHIHQDNAPNSYIHIRANWMLKKPPIGGDPVLNNEVVSVQEGDLWICFASEEKHASTPIFGGQRLICSFGALVKRPVDFNLGKFFNE